MRYNHSLATEDETILNGELISDAEKWMHMRSYLTLVFRPAKCDDALELLERRVISCFSPDLFQSLFSCGKIARRVYVFELAVLRVTFCRKIRHGQQHACSFHPHKLLQRCIFGVTSSFLEVVLGLLRVVLTVWTPMACGCWTPLRGDQMCTG